MKALSMNPFHLNALGLFTKTLLGASCLLGFAGSAIANSGSAPTPTTAQGIPDGSTLEVIEEWKNFQQVGIDTPPNDRASLVFVRVDSDTTTRKSINIYINGSYQSSLISNAFTQNVACPGINEISTAYAEVGKVYQQKVAGQQAITLKPGEIRVISVVEESAGTQPSLRTLTAQEAQAILAILPPRQRHTIPRVKVKECKA